MKMSQMSLLASAMNPLGLASIPNFKEGVSYTKRVPNCQKCGQHGRKSRLKGHKRVCPFRDCECPKCQVVTERQKLMADQIKIRRRQRKDSMISLTREKISATLNAAAAVAAATPLPYLNNLNMIYNQLNQTQPNVSIPPTTSEAQTIITSATSPIQKSASPINTSPTVLAPQTDPNTSTTQIPVTNCFLQGSVGSDLNAGPMTSSTLQLPLLLGNNPNAAALAALVSSSSSTMSNLPATSVANTTQESEIHISQQQQQHSPTTISQESSLPKPIPINPLTNYSNSLLSTATSLFTPEQILVILANLQLSNCLNNFNQDFNFAKSNYDNIKNGNILDNTCAKQSAESNNNTFIDVCSV